MFTFKTLASAIGRNSIQVAILGSAMTFTATAGFAASITNLDQQPRTVLVTSGGAAKDLTLAPQQKIDNFCVAPCVIALKGNEDEFEIAEQDNIVIEEGVFYLDADDNVPELPQGSGGDVQMDEPPAGGSSLDN